MIDESVQVSHTLPPSVSALDLLDTAPISLLVIDQDRRILYATRQAADRLGCPGMSLCSQCLDRWMDAEALPALERAVRAAFDEGRSSSWCAQLVIKAATERVEIAIHPVLGGDRTVAARVVLWHRGDEPRSEPGDAICDMRTLQELGEALQSSLDLRHTYEAIVRATVTILGYRMALLAVVDEKRKALVLRASFVSPDLRSDSRVLDGEWWEGVEIPIDGADGLLMHLARGKQMAVSYSLSEVLGSAIDPRRAEALQRELRSAVLLVIPLLSRGQLVGSLIAGADRPQVADREIALMTAFASQSAMAIENAKLYDTANQRLAEVSMLYMLANQVSSSLDLNVVLNSVMDILKRVLNCRGGCIFLWDENHEYLQIRASAGIKPYWQREARMRPGEGIGGQVALTAQPVYIRDTRKEPDFIVFDPAVRSLLVVPLIFKGEVIGTLDVDDDKPDAFSEDVAQLLSIAAAQAAAAIQTARLYTDLKERAERLAQAHRELQESHRVRSEFVQNVSHELRTPLTFVQGYVELLLDGTLGSLTERQRESLEIVASRTQTIIELVNDILSLQKVERGDIEFRAVDLEAIARSAVQSAQATAQQAGLILVEEYEPDLPPVYGSPDHLEQVFNNLIHNALKFSSEPGGMIRVRLSDAGDVACVDVIDQGIGIARDQLTKIFERFYQVDGSTTRRFGGTGLGLAIVKEIVDAHGGTVMVESEQGVGSTFSFTIPYAHVQSGTSEGVDDGDSDL